MSPTRFLQVKSWYNMTIVEFVVASFIYFFVTAAGVTVRVYVFNIKKKEVILTVFGVIILYVFYLVKYIFAF